MEEIRIQKLLSRNGSFSRRRVEELISQKRIKVNGKIIDSFGLKCKPSDVIEVDNKVIEIDLNKERIYLLMNKPKNYICSLYDPNKRKKIIDLIDPSLGRLVPVGRLDYDTSGLIMLTNDGEFCNYITHPSTSPEKEYVAFCKNPPTGDEEKKISNGVFLQELNYLAKDIKGKIISFDKTNTTFSITLHEGKKHEVKLILEEIGHKVISLERIRIGSIYLKDLKAGEYRKMTKEEIESFNYKINI